MYTHCTAEHISFVCLTDEKQKTETAFQFLEAVRDQFTRRYSATAIDNSVAHGLSFVDDLRMIMEEFNANPNPDKVRCFYLIM